MSGNPPDWGDIPPPDVNSYGGDGRGSGAQNGQRNGAGRPSRPKLTSDQVQHAASAFYAWLTDKDTLRQLRVVLPDPSQVEIFISTCKTAVLNKPDLLQENYRSSLMVAVLKAASQGLKPDGREGALIPRWSNEARGYAVCWQAMVHGIMKLGRETGAIRSIRAIIVYHGEPFRIEQGDEDKIHHEVDIDLEEEAFNALHTGLDEHKNPKADPEAYFDLVRAAYCVITGADGTVTKRWMSAKRIKTLRDSAKAKDGPWNSVWLPEMICKSVILLTSKWINLDADSVPAKRFQAALLHDLEVDFGDQGNQIGQDAPQPRALEAPGTKLDAFEQLHRKREPVPVGAEVGGGDDAPSSPSPNRTAAEGSHQPGEDPSVSHTDDGAVDPNLEERVNVALDYVAGLSQEKAYDVVASDNYRSLVRTLNNEGQFVLLKRLTDAVALAQKGRP